MISNSNLESKPDFTPPKTEIIFSDISDYWQKLLKSAIYEPQLLDKFLGSAKFTLNNPNLDISSFLDLLNLRASINLKQIQANNIISFLQTFAEQSRNNPTLFGVLLILHQTAKKIYPEIIAYKFSNSLLFSAYQDNLQKLKN